MNNTPSNWTPDTLWQQLRQEANHIAATEPVLTSYVHNALLHHATLPEAVSFHLAQLLDSNTTPALLLRGVFLDILLQTTHIIEQLCQDLVACYERDAACDHYLMPLLYFKGFQALQTYRLAHALWLQDRKTLALHIQHRMSEVFCVDIHPAARIGAGILVDHATGVVIGETAVIGDNVSMLHAVTLGGSGTQHTGARHPVIRHGVLLSTGAKVLGPVDIGAGAKIGAGSVVLQNVPAHSTAAGVPARIIGAPTVDEPARDMDHQLGDTPDD